MDEKIDNMDIYTEYLENLNCINFIITYKHNIRYILINLILNQLKFSIMCCIKSEFNFDKNQLQMKVLKSMKKLNEIKESVVKTEEIYEERIEFYNFEIDPSSATNVIIAKYETYFQAKFKYS